MSEDINEYMNFFKNQTLKDKQSIIYEQLQILTGLTNNMCKDDVAEVIIVLINSIQNAICDYSNGISNLRDKINN